MSATFYGITSNAITWLQEESELAYDETNKVTIKAVGLIEYEEGSGSLVEAVGVIPPTLNVTASGPIGLYPQFSDATASAPSARFSGDGCIEVTVTYTKANPETPFPNPDGNDESESDRAQRAITTQSAPLLTHPVALQFDREEKSKLSALLRGDAWANPTYDSAATEGIQQYEFLNEDPDDSDSNTPVECSFSATDVTVDEITASPLDFARLIAAGVDQYDAPTVRHELSVVRDEAATDEEISKVGEVVPTPNLAPELGENRQWFHTGITETSPDLVNWSRTYSYDLSGPGGILKALYKGGIAEI